RSSWKKSWDLEPPGWQSRFAHLPIEVLAISPADGTSIRDVFSGGRTSLNMGVESDWIDGDDDVPAFAGGLGQMGTSSSGGFVGGSAFNASANGLVSSPSPFRSASAESVSVFSRGHRSKSSRSPGGRVSPLPSGTTFEPTERAGRRQLPARSGAASKWNLQ
ncbi:hypothetical protein EV714DRAFT_176514, partial [Schizophyllum commune]